MMIQYDEMFEWDTNKDYTNRIKHELSFEEAATVFTDPMLMIIPDTTTDTDEEVFQAIGKMPNSYNILLVAHTYRDQNGEEIIRIISARKLSKGEVKKHGYRN